ncbi:MAG: hypothetical protein ACLU8F_03370 [Clostridia bacterium]
MGTKWRLAQEMLKILDDKILEGVKVYIHQETPQNILHKLQEKNNAILKEVVSKARQKNKKEVYIHISNPNVQNPKIWCDVEKEVVHAVLM